MSDVAVIVLEQVFLYFPLVFGAYLGISLLKLPDLSIEAAYVFGAIMGAKALLLTQGMSGYIVAPLVFGMSLLGGIIVGIISSFFTQMCGIPHLLSGILTIGLFHGVNQFVLGTSIISLNVFYNPLRAINLFPRNPEFFVLACACVVLVVLGFLLLRTQIGYSFAVYGNNPRFFEHYRISTSFVVMVGIALSNALAGLSGYFVAQSSGFVDVSGGFGMALFCVTSLILGKSICFFITSFSVIIPLTGIFSYCLVQQMLLKVGFNLKYFTMIQSALVLIVLIARYRRLGQAKRHIDNLGV